MEGVVFFCSIHVRVAHSCLFTLKSLTHVLRKLKRCYVTGLSLCPSADLHRDENAPIVHSPILSTGLVLSVYCRRAYAPIFSGPFSNVYVCVHTQMYSCGYALNRSSSCGTQLAVYSDCLLLWHLGLPQLCPSFGTCAKPWGLNSWSQMCKVSSHVSSPERLLARVSFHTQSRVPRMRYFLRT